MLMAEGTRHKSSFPGFVFRTDIPSRTSQPVDLVYRIDSFGKGSASSLRLTATDRLHRRHSHGPPRGIQAADHSQDCAEAKTEQQ